MRVSNFVVRYFMFILVCNHLDGEERDGCFAIIFAFLVADPYGAKVFFSAVVIVVFPDHTHYF